MQTIERYNISIQYVIYKYLFIIYLCAQTFLCSKFFFCLQFTSKQINLLDRKCIISQKFSSTWKKVVHDFLTHLWKWILVEKKIISNTVVCLRTQPLALMSVPLYMSFSSPIFPVWPTNPSIHADQKDPEKNREINFLEQKLSFCFCYFVKVRWEPIIRVLMYWLLTYN